MECNRVCIICGSVSAVCKLEWVYGFWDNGVDVSHDQPFKALHSNRRECYESVVFRQVTLMVLRTGTMVVCLKHVGITDSDRERLKCQ